MTVYIVVSGECSDFGIEAVFTNKTKAENYRNIRNRQNPSLDARVVEYEADEVEAKSTIIYWVYEKLSNPNHSLEATPWNSPLETLGVELGEVNGFPDGTTFEVFVEAESPEAAIKIGAEKISKHRASLEGL